MKSIKLSICIPTYNRPDTLEVTLESISKLMGNAEGIEICISDNASGEKTKKIVDKYAEKLPIKYYRHANEIHAMQNIDYTVSNMAIGEYFLLIGDDDIFINDGIRRLIELIDSEHSDYYYLNHIHAAIKENQKTVYVNNCNKEYCVNNCESYIMDSGWVDKWEELLTYPGKDQEVNMLFIGNHLMKRQLWNMNVNDIVKDFKKYQNSELTRETLDFYYGIWSPHVLAVARAMMGKKAFYVADPIISQGDGLTISDRYQVMLLTYLTRWLKDFQLLNMDKKIYEKYKKFIQKVQIERCINLMLYKPDVVKKYSFCLDFIAEQESMYEFINEFTENVRIKQLDYYLQMASNIFEQRMYEVLNACDGEIVLWGTGDVGKRIVESSVALKKYISYIVDANEKVKGQIFEPMGLKIHTPDELKDQNISVVIIASVKYIADIKQRLKKIIKHSIVIISTNGIEEFGINDNI